MGFFQDVGNFFKNLGTGVTTTVQGFGENLQSQSQLNLAQAEQIRANAQATELRLRLDAEQKRRQHELIVIALIGVLAVPLVGMAIYYGLKNK